MYGRVIVGVRDVPQVNGVYLVLSVATAVDQIVDMSGCDFARAARA